MKRQGKAKTFILDTNVILHDATCIHQFQENDIVIPLVVIEEIDHFKRGSQVINFNAREFARTLDSITGNALFNGGISLGKGKGKVRIAITKGLSPEIQDAFREDTPDHRILSVALELQKKTRYKNSVILVTKDVNLRMKAKAISIPAEDYSTDRVHSIEALYGGKEIIENVEGSLIGNLYQSPYEVAADRFRSACGCELIPNKYFILKNSSQSALAVIDQDCSILRKVEKLAAYGIKPRNAEQTFAIDALTRTIIPLVTLTDKAGTGKTLLALAADVSRSRVGLNSLCRSL